MIEKKDEEETPIRRRRSDVRVGSRVASGLTAGVGVLLGAGLGGLGLVFGLGLALSGLGASSGGERRAGCDEAE